MYTCIMYTCKHVRMKQYACYVCMHAYNVRMLHMSCAYESMCTCTLNLSIWPAEIHFDQLNFSMGLAYKYPIFKKQINL